MKTAPEYLTEAEKTLSARGKQYDKAGNQERSMAQVVAMFNALFPDSPLTEYQGWRFMQCLKMVRALRAPHEDSEMDGIAYAALAAECRMSGTESDMACKCRRCQQSANPPEKFPMVTMSICPSCGNKRCPKATFHENECTGSNEPGQKGSDY